MQRSYKARVDRDGRILIPIELRLDFQLREGDEVLLKAQGGTIRVTPQSYTITRVQELIAQYREFGRGVLKEFIREQEEQAIIEQQEIEDWYVEHTAAKRSRS